MKELNRVCRTGAGRKPAPVFLCPFLLCFLPFQESGTPGGGADLRYETAGFFSLFKKCIFPDGSAGMPHIYVPLRRCEAGLFIYAGSAPVKLPVDFISPEKGVSLQSPSESGRCRTKT